MILVAISILWIPIIRATQGSGLFAYIQAIQSFLAPPIAACYLLGVLWKRINEEVNNNLKKITSKNLLKLYHKKSNSFNFLFSPS